MLAGGKCRLSSPGTGTRSTSIHSTNPGCRVSSTARQARVV